MPHAIYFAGSITGGRAQAAIYPIIVATLRHHGEVLTEHVSAATLSDAGELIHKSPGDIFDRDVAWVDTADLLVAEVTVPSLGVGYEVGRAEARQIPVIALFDERAGRPLSAMIAGNPHIHLIRYASHEHLLETLHHVLPQLLPTRDPSA